MSTVGWVQGDGGHLLIRREVEKEIGYDEGFRFHVIKSNILVPKT